MQSLNYKNFKIGVIISVLLGVFIISISLLLGKNAFFLLLNADIGKFADNFFKYFTYTGDGLVWLIVLFVLLAAKQKQFLPLCISSFTISTILTQVCKYIIVPDEARPIKAISNISSIHVVSGVELHTISSFPSGHTATAFTIYLLFCLIVCKNWWLVIGLLYALLVGYSRVYLAQHFPLDVGAGILTGVASVTLSLQVQKWWMNRKTLHG
jgi:membrane-associated phospholipid phosphatase